MNNEYLGTPLKLEGHPLFKKPVKYRIRYIAALEYCVNKYAAGNEFAEKAVMYYKKKFGVSDFSEQDISPESPEKLKLYRIIYVLMCDVLYLCALTDDNKGREIINDFKGFYNAFGYDKKTDDLFAALYKSGSVKKFLKFKSMIKRFVIVRDFYSKPLKKILVTATMSAGKSTLLNALTGKKINLAKSEACTAKIHYIFNKPIEDGLTYELDGDLNIEADEEALMNDSESNITNEIGVGTYFFSDLLKKCRLCFIDTPGVNSALNPVHKKISDKAISDEDYDVLIYIFNAERLHTDDETPHLKYVSEHVDKKKVIFLVNKLDSFTSSDSVKESLEGVKKTVEQYGFAGASVYPISAYPAMLLKFNAKDNTLNDDEIDELEQYKRKFSKVKNDLSQYYNMDFEKNNLAVNCGVYCLEKILTGGNNK